MIRDKRALVHLLKRHNAPGFLVNELRESASIGTATSSRAGDLHDIYAQRERVQRDPRARAPHFKGFRTLLRTLQRLPREQLVSITEVASPKHEVLLFSDERGHQLWGLLYAKVDHADFWHEYAEDRARLAYERGVNDTVARLRRA